MIVISREHNLDLVLYKFRELHARALLLLADNVLAEGYTHSEENAEFQTFIKLTEATLMNFDTLKKEFLNIPSYKKLFLKIDSSFKTIERHNLDYNQRTHQLKESFVQNLQLAFHSIPFFRFRITTVMIIYVVGVLTRVAGLLAWIGVKRVSFKVVDKFNHIIQTYTSIVGVPPSKHQNHG